LQSTAETIEHIAENKLGAYWEKDFERLIEHFAMLVAALVELFPGNDQLVMLDNVLPDRAGTQMSISTTSFVSVLLR